MQFSGFIEASNRTTTVGEVFNLLCEATLPLDYRKLGLFALTNDAQNALAPLNGEHSPILISNYPEDFSRRYTQAGRHEIDPVLLLAREELSPLVWDDVIGRTPLSADQEALNAERQSAGLYNEVTCPVHGPNGQTYALRFALSQPGPCDRTHLSALQVLAIHSYYAFARVWQSPTESASSGMADNSQLAMPEPSLLSQREQECMLWTARGKSASSISVILGLSENTVNFYVKNAMRKLGTTNRVVAVVLAVRKGLIQP